MDNLTFGVGITFNSCPAGDLPHDLLGQGYPFMHASLSGIANIALNMLCIYLFFNIYIFGMLIYLFIYFFKLLALVQSRGE